MDRIITIENFENNVEYVNQFSMHAQEYLNAINNHESVVIDFRYSDRIDQNCSMNLFGRLLIDEKLPFVLCKNISQRPEVVRAIFDGVSRSFQRAYPSGIWYDGMHLTLPQIEMYDPSGDRIYSVVKLSDEEYEAINR